MTHDIKIMKEFADAVASGDKTFEIRENDRSYQRGDFVVFHVMQKGMAFLLPMADHPLNGKRYEITYVLSGWGLQDGYVALGIRPADGGADDGRD